MPKPTLFPFLDFSPMSGDELRAVRGRISAMIGRPVRQVDIAPVFGTKQAQYSAWETAGTVPERVAMIARLFEERVRTVTLHPSLRPDEAVLTKLADLVTEVSEGFDEGGFFNALNAMSLASGAGVTSWLLSFREQQHVTEALVTEG